MSERCIHCALQEVLDRVAAERAASGQTLRLSEALYALGAVYRDLIANVDGDLQETAALFFQAGATVRSTSEAPASARVH